MPKIGLITTLNHNIGDDFVRIGIQHILNKVFASQNNIDYVLINKHNPLSIYKAWHPLGISSKVLPNLQKGRRLIEKKLENYFYKFPLHKFQDTDIIVQCGAPVIFDGCSKSEWVLPLWYHIIGNLYKKSKVFNLAAGSCFPIEDQPSRILKNDDLHFLNDITSFCKATTVRDELAFNLFKGIGQEVTLLPCSAFLATDLFKYKINESAPIVVNYMENGGHYSFGQEIDKEKWQKNFSLLLDELVKRHKVVILCHNRKELELANNLFPDFESFLPVSVKQYFDFISQAKFGVYNRLHACVALASCGIPSIGIGTDTRMLMLAELGIKYFFVNHIEIDLLVNLIEDGIVLRNVTNEMFYNKKKETEEKYIKLITEKST